jgi:hypothetical protein
MSLIYPGKQDTQCFLTATSPLSRRSLHQDLLSPRPEESMLFQLLLGSSITHSLLGNIPFVYREIRPRGVARLTTLTGQSNTEIPMVKGQPRVVSTCTASLDLSISRVPKLRCPASVPPRLHYASRVPLCHVHFGASRISESTAPSPLLLNPQMPNPRYSGFVPPVPPEIDGPDQVGESPFAISTCMGFLHSPTPIRRYAMAKGSFAV